MQLRLLALSFIVVMSLSCRDSPTRPDPVAGPPPPLTIAELAAQLRGDPFLRRLAAQAGDSSIVEQLDRAFVAIADQVGVGVPERAIGSSRVLLLQLSEAAAGDSSPTKSPSEQDILNGVLELAVEAAGSLLQTGPSSAPTPVPPPPTDR
jgi:hypothetical protein